MATPTSAEQPGPRPALAIARHVAGPPRRSAAATWEQIAGLMTRTLTARAYPDTPAVDATLRRLQPLGRMLIIMHLIEEGSGCLVFDTDDLRLTVTVGYDAGTGEDVALPPVEVLDALPIGAPLSLNIQLAASLDVALLERLAAAGRPGPLSVTITPPVAPIGVPELPQLPPMPPITPPAERPAEQPIDEPEQPPAKPTNDASNESASAEPADGALNQEEDHGHD